MNTSMHHAPKIYKYLKKIYQKAEKPKKVRPKVTRVITDSSISTRISKVESNYGTNTSSANSARSYNTATSSSKQAKNGAISAQTTALNQILAQIGVLNRGVYTFLDYLNVLKSMGFVNGTSLTQKEEELVTKSWHLISFYQVYNIVTNEENIRTFLYGIIGVSGDKLYHRNTVRFYIFILC
jgi:hypothetical protein